MEKNTVWSRVGAWLRGDESEGSLEKNPSEFRSPSTTVQTEQDRGIQTIDMKAAPAPSTSEPSIKKNGPVDRSVSGITDHDTSTDRLAELVVSIKEHLEAQVQGADVLVGALDRLADGLERLPDAAKNELEVLERIGRDVAGTVGTLKRLESSVSQTPKLADAQREAVVTLTNELGRFRETDEKIAGVLEGVQGVMVELRDGIGRSAGAMREFRTEMAERHDTLAQLVEQQSRRFVGLATGAIILGSVAVILGIISVIL